jgi:DNA-binding protein HU-beta
MNKADLVQFVRSKTALSAVDCEKVIAAVFEGISGALERGEEVSFIGFGSFAVGERSARTGRNPRTGETIQIPASKQVRFRPGKVLKDRVAA